MTTPTPDDSARRQARAELLPQLLAAELRAASGGEITREQAQAVVAPLNPAMFLTAAGDVDLAAITAYVEPIAAGMQGLEGLRTGLGQGQQGTQPTSGRDAGLAEARRRWPEKYAEQQPAGAESGQGQPNTIPPPASRDAGRDEARRRFGDETQPVR
jgi:hypothetical protein